MSNPFAPNGGPTKPVKPVKDPFADGQSSRPPLTKQPSNPFAKEVKSNPFGESSAPTSPAGVQHIPIVPHKAANPFGPPSAPKPFVGGGVKPPQVPSVPSIPPQTVQSGNQFGQSDSPVEWSTKPTVNAPIVQKQSSIKSSDLGNPFGQSSPSIPKQSPVQTDQIGNPFGQSDTKIEWNSQASAPSIPINSPPSSDVNSFAPSVTTQSTPKPALTAPPPVPTHYNDEFDTESVKPIEASRGLTAPPPLPPMSSQMDSVLFTASQQQQQQQQSDDFSSFTVSKPAVSAPPPVPTHYTDEFDTESVKAIKASRGLTAPPPLPPMSSQMDTVLFSAAQQTQSDDFSSFAPGAQFASPPAPQFADDFGSNFDSFAPTSAASSDPFAPSVPIAPPVVQQQQQQQVGGFEDDYDMSSFSRSAPQPNTFTASAPQTFQSQQQVQRAPSGGFDSFDFVPSSAAPAAPTAGNSASGGFDTFDSFEASTAAAGPSNGSRFSETDSFSTRVGVVGNPFASPAASVKADGGFPAATSAVSDDFNRLDSFGSAPAPPPPVPVVEPEPVGFFGLPQLVPQSIDPIDDEFIISTHAHHHHNEPVHFAPAVVPTQRRSFTAPVVKPANSTGGDPFATLVKPLKSDVAASVAAPVPVDPNAGLSLSQIAAKKNNEVLAAKFNVQAPVVAPVAVSNNQFASQPAANQTFTHHHDNFAPTASVGGPTGGFDDWTTTTTHHAAQPAADFDTFSEFGGNASHASVSTFDSFGADPFSNNSKSVVAPVSAPAEDWMASAPLVPKAVPQKPQVAPQKQAVPVRDDFDVFGSTAPLQPLIAPQNTFQSAPKPQAISAANAPRVDDFDIFSPKKNASPPVPTVTKVASGASVLQQHEYDIFSPKRTIHSGSADSFDFDFQKQPSIAANSDPFGGDSSDPFAPSHSHADPFHPSSQGSEDQTEVMEKFRQMYNIGEEQDDDEGDEGHDSDDLDFDHNRQFKAHKMKSTVTGGSTISTLTANTTADASEQGPKEGDILARLSTRSLVTKDWHDTFYIIEQGCLFLYRNKLDYQYNPKGVNYKKKIPITHNLRLLKINCKEYKGYGLVYNFMLEEVLDYGPSNVGKFGSTYRPVLDLLWNRLKEMILKKRKEKSTPVSKYGK